jgi:diacylglycerol kinase (ATP)
MRIKVVINPGAGQPEPVLSILNTGFAEAGIDWDVAITHGPGDGETAAAEAVKAGFDLIGAYGGDGTVSEVASALASGGPPMVVLPGGTGNALAEDLGIPKALDEAVALVAGGDYDTRPVDLGRVGERWFVLRLTMGFEASVAEAATRELKDRFGWLAYAFAALQESSDPPRAKYTIDVDGESIEAEGVACLIANSASLGVVGVKIAEDVSVSDGLLDVLVVDRANLLPLLGTATSMAAGQESPNLARWRGNKIAVHSRPRQSVLTDGEPAGRTPVEVTVAPGAVTVVVPKGSAPSGSAGG